MSKTIEQTVTIPASAHEVYEALMDSKKHADFTGDEADISKEVGGSFSVYGDYATGENLALEQDKKIVQKWRGSDWEEGVYSTATFELKDINGKTELQFTQTDVPDDSYEDIKQGWLDYYWQPLQKYFAK